MGKKNSQKKTRKETHRGWVFTCNNYEQEDIEKLGEADPDYLIYAHEVGKSGTPHLQGYLYIKNKISFTALRERLGDRFFIEPQKGTTADAILYCMKDGYYVELGNRPSQGKRTDLHIIQKDIENGTPEKQIAKQYFSQWCQYRRAFREYRELQVKFDTLIVLYMESSICSTRAASKYLTSDSIRLESWTTTVLLDYFSGKYRYILISYWQPLRDMFDEDIEKNIRYIIV